MTCHAISPVVFCSSPNRGPHTQLLAQAFSNCASSGAQACLAFSSSFTLSTMPFRSRHLKKLSLPSQQTALADLSGAMNPPSCDGSGGGGAACELPVLNQPILGRINRGGACVLSEVPLDRYLIKPRRLGDVRCSYGLDVSFVSFGCDDLYICNRATASPAASSVICRTPTASMGRDDGCTHIDRSPLPLSPRMSCRYYVGSAQR